MNKDFKKWHDKKGNIDKVNKRPFFHEREIWFCHLGLNIGFEQDGKGEDFLRPILIIRKFNNEIFWGVPLTRANKNLPFYFAFTIQSETEGNDEKVTAILSQVRLIDAKRLRRMIGYISKEDLANLKEKLKALLP